jgi:hypothetical protein
VLEIAILRLTSIYSFSAARLCELLAVILAAKWRQSDLAAKFKPVLTMLDQIEGLCAVFVSETKAHKGDAVLQKAIPELIDLVGQLLAQSEGQSIDWQQHPKTIGIISQRQIDNVLSSVEATPLFDLAKEVCTYLTNLVGEREVGPGAARVLANIIDMIPLYGNMAFEKVRGQLSEVVDAVFADPNTAPDALVAQASRAIAAVIPQSGSEASETLGISAVNIMDQLVDLASGNVAKVARPRKVLIHNFQKLKVFLGATIDQADVVRTAAIDALVSLVEGIPAGNADLVQIQVGYVDSLQATAIRDGNRDQLLADARLRIAPLTSRIAEAASSNHARTNCRFAHRQMAQERVCIREL